ncbi:uncharacterized protein J3D65DRAFT_76062 [Phyllosticta citribraziliensis]|uniref:Uncharacterized protein n=1 Tax=Phyllosticta citribraziliensis TaxID=989973 RepID=A0ABR1LDD8_9PEZI
MGGGRRGWTVVYEKSARRGRGRSAAVDMYVFVYVLYLYLFKLPCPSLVLPPGLLRGSESSVGLGVAVCVTYLSLSACLAKHTYVCNCGACAHTATCVVRCITRHIYMPKWYTMWSMVVALALRQTSDVR